MRLYRFAVLCLLTCVMFISCATSIALNVKKPAEINMSGARKIAVLDFDYPRQRRTNDLIQSVLLRLTGIDNVKSNTVEERVAAYATTRIISGLMNTGYFEVLGSDEMVNAMINTPEAHPSAVQIGKTAGAQAIIVGEVLTLDIDDSREVEEIQEKDSKTGRKTAREEYYVRRDTRLVFSYRVINTATGSLLATKDFSDQMSDRQLERNRDRLVPAEDMCRTMIDRAVPRIVRQLAPYTVTEYRTLMNDEMKDPGMEAADRYVKDRMYEKALDMYLRIWDSSKNVAAGVNGAIMYEALGTIDEGIALLSEVVDRTANGTANRELVRMRETRREQEEVAAQL